jgi:cell division protein ZapE
MPGQTRAAYKARLAAGALAPDPAQARAVETLARVELDLAALNPPGLFPRGLFRKSRGVRGAYVWGPVGRGKSMLMDMFFEAAPVTAKSRRHFHEFMAEIHALVGVWRGAGGAERKRRFGTGKGDDPIPPVADVIAKRASLLCFDELEVTDIADAMILGRLFSALFDRGVTLVATSNRPPTDLYRDGVNRQLFLPVIDMLLHRLEIVAVNGPRDYRVERLRSAGTWFSPIDPDNRGRFDALWMALLAGADEGPDAVEVLGRREPFARISGALLRATFDEICGRALGPEDFLAIARRFQTLFLEDVPRLSPERPNEARRLAILIDTLYEARARLVVLAAAEPGALYPAGDQAFEFQRAVSRLEEMRSADWLGAVE